MLPIELDLTGVSVLVVGGGAVGRRKARRASEAGAAVRLIDPLPRPTDFDAAGVEWIAASYAKSWLDGVFCVFAAGPAEVNAVVVADCSARGLLVCDAAVPERGNFTLPAVGRVGPISVAVSTGGASPRLAARLRDELVAGIDPAMPAWVELLDALRPEILRDVADPVARRELFAELASSGWGERLRTESREAVAEAMRDLIRGRKGGSSPGRRRPPDAGRPG